MSSAPTPEPSEPKPRLVFDDPLDQQSSDDTDRGWGELPTRDDDDRLRAERPPHWD
jgi:hypothetical protein